MSTGHDMLDEIQNLRAVFDRALTRAAANIARLTRERDEALQQAIQQRDYLQEARASWQAHCAESANKFADQRDELQRKLDSVSEELATLRARCAQTDAQPVNSCEHGGDHPAPPGHRFCSEACSRCEGTDFDASAISCAGLCGNKNQGQKDCG